MEFSHLLYERSAYGLWEEKKSKGNNTFVLDDYFCFIKKIKGISQA